MFEAACVMRVRTVTRLLMPHNGRELCSQDCSKTR